MRIDAVKSDDLLRKVSSQTQFQSPSCTRLPATVGRDRLDCNGLIVSFRDGAPVAADLPHRRRHLIAKRALDVVLSVSAIVALSPILAAVALLIKLEDGGPVLFRQQRVGKGGNLFEVLKFRSMRIDACDSSGAQMTRQGDSRITRIGRWIRKASLDELPQLFNILKGNMSVVGPRPHVSSQSSDGQPMGEVVPYYDYRQHMLPGLTGWAQANGYRGPTDDPSMAIARINHDIAYIENFSFWLDVKSILYTMRPEFLFGKAF